MPKNLPTGSESTPQLPNLLWLPVDWYELNIAVALSGGADSVSLLRSLQYRKQQQGGAGQLLAFHVDHQLRGKESTADALWCQQQCDALGVPLEILTCNTKQITAEIGDGLEAAARTTRYELLTAAAQQAGVRYLATAHTQDDQVETVLFRILRGTGLHGLAGIPRTRDLTSSLTLIRPLLDCSRQQINEYLIELDQSHRTDRSNSDLQFTRNRLRNELLPLLRENYNPELDAALIRLATQADDAGQVLQHQAQQLLNQAKLIVSLTQLTLHLAAFTNQKKSIACEALRIAWREAKLPEQAMTYQWWTQLADMMLSPTEGQVFNLPGNIRASIASGNFLLQWPKG